METDKVPLEKGSPEEILRKLGDNFSLDDGVITALLRLGVESLQEFRFLWASEQAIEPWVAKLGLGDKALLMTARVRRAWAAVGLYYRQVEQDRSKIALSDLDTMLGETELRDTKQQFWRRYKMRFPPEIHPADTTIARVAREMQKRMLCVYNIWRVKTLQFQLTTSQKKRKLSEGLFLEDGDDEEVVTHDVDNYLDRLFTLIVGVCHGRVLWGDRSTGCRARAQPRSRYSQVCQRPHGHRLQVLLQSQAQCGGFAHITAHAMAPDQGCGGT